MIPSNDPKDDTNAPSVPPEAGNHTHPSPFVYFRNANVLAFPFFTMEFLKNVIAANILPVWNCAFFPTLNVIRS